MKKFEQTQLSLTISDPVALLREVADRYSSAERVLMEFVDNPIDDAEEMLRLNGNTTYPRNIKIKVHLDSQSRSVTITDNCRGMTYDTLIRIVSKIGESRKRGCSWLNGRFGFGIHSFRAIAESIRIRTKHASGDLCEISFTRDQLEGIVASKHGNLPLNAEFQTGTEITITAIDLQVWKTLTAETIKEAIEHHFETLLKRENLEISVQKDAGSALICLPFDYASVEGKEFQYSLTVKTRNALYPVSIFLKVSKIANKQLSPRFFAKGRRINDMKSIPSFISRSSGRTRVWGHDHLIGYVEVGDALTPVITRDEFKANSLRDLVYAKILEHETEIKAALDEINEKQHDTQMNKLANVFSKLLSDFARADLIKMRSEQTVDDEDENGPGGGRGARTGGNRGTNSGGKGNPPGGGKRGGGDDENGGSRKNREGLNVSFRKLGPDAEGIIPRSHMLEGSIVINTAHPQFETRASRTRQGSFKMNARLLSYICGVIAYHYKSAFYEKYGRQPEEREQLFEDQFDLQCKFEEALLPQIGNFEQQLNGSTEEDVA